MRRGGRARGIAVLVVATLGLPVPALAHRREAAKPDRRDKERRAALGEPCRGADIEPDRVITGSFGTDEEGSYVMLPFFVPRGTTAVRVKYCYDQPQAPTNARIRHTLDLGLYESRHGRRRGLWGMKEFRGWGGSSHPDVTVSAQGFSSREQYTSNPREDPPGKTTRAFRPGPIRPGRWAVELGVASVVPQSQGDDDGRVEWRVEIELSSKKRYAQNRYRPTDYDERPARSASGWYAGDMHVHAEHSAYGDATMREVFDYAFGPLSEGKAGLDFITLSDYVSGSGWGEIGRFQGEYPKNLIIRSAEVITYRGHFNNHASGKLIDYRAGPIYKRRRNGELKLLRGPTPPRERFREIREAGGFTQINHPTIFPSQVPGFDAFCRGCPWDYSDEETGYERVDGIEVTTGPPGLQAPPQPGPNPFTPLAIEFWENALDDGHKIAAVGVSDSHNAGRRPDPVTQAPIGTGTTVVYARELSEKGIRDGVMAGHTYVKVFGNFGPDLRFQATPTGSDQRPAIMGDTLRTSQADFVARVMGGGPSSDPDRPGTYTLVVYKGRNPLLTVPVTSDDFVFPFPSAGAGRYRLQLQRGTAIEAVSSPIYLEPRSG